MSRMVRLDGAEEASSPRSVNSSPVLYGLGDKLREALIFLKVC